MSDQETTRQVEHHHGGDFRDDLSRLSELARQAYEQRRTTDCLDLTRAILLIDPENAEAQAMRNSMRTALHQDLEKARAVFRPADPAPLPGSASHPRSPSRHTADISIPGVPNSDTTGEADGESLPQPEQRVEAVPLFRETLAQRRAHAEKKWRPRVLDVAAALVVLALAIAAVPMYRSLSNPHTPAAAESSDNPGPLEPFAPNGLELSNPLDAGYTLDFQASQEANPAAAATAPMASIPPPHLVASQPPGVLPTAITAPNAVPAGSAQKNPEPAVRLPSKGTLAVSAPIATEIYVDGRLSASAPAALEFPAGTHTLEYRLGSLRKSVAHVIRPGETTLATITFDVSVSINANPWADVFLEGPERKLLGQTPLRVQLPVGSVLIFENPKFEAKKHLITGNETGIQMVFP